MATAAVAGGQLVSTLVSPLPLLILAGLVLTIWLPIAALLLTPIWSSCPKRNARARAMVDRVLTALPGSRPAATDSARQVSGPAKGHVRGTTSRPGRRGQ
jgi:hypothetical protein